METTKFALASALFSGGPLSVYRGFALRELFTIVNAVQREDGSNKSFNVSGLDINGATVTHCIRTID